MPSLYHHYLIIQLIFDDFFPGFPQFSSTFRAHLVSMYRVFCHLILAKTRQFCFPVSLLSPLVFSTLFSRVRNPFLLMQWCSAGRHPTVTPIQIHYPFQTSHFPLQRFVFRSQFCCFPLQPIPLLPLQLIQPLQSLYFLVLRPLLLQNSLLCFFQFFVISIKYLLVMTSSSHFHHILFFSFLILPLSLSLFNIFLPASSSCLPVGCE